MTLLQVLLTAVITQTVTVLISLIVVLAKRSHKLQEHEIIDVAGRYFVLKQIYDLQIKSLDDKFMEKHAGAEREFDRQSVEIEELKSLIDNLRKYLQEALPGEIRSAVSSSMQPIIQMMRER